MIATPQPDFAELEAAENKFRFRAFEMYYHTIYADEVDPVVRFVRAILASGGPIKDQDLMLEWFRSPGRNKVVEKVCSEDQRR